MSLYRVAAFLLPVALVALVAVALRSFPDLTAYLTATTTP